MARTPDRSPGAMIEDEEIRFVSNATGPTVAGAFNYNGTEFVMRDAVGTFNPRSSASAFTTSGTSVETAFTASFPAGLSGSLTRLADGTSYLIAGTNVTIFSSSNGSITISSTGGFGGSAEVLWQSSIAGQIFTTASLAQVQRVSASNGAIITGSLAHGTLVVASAQDSHAQGTNTLASAAGTHAEGYFTTASAVYAHSEGDLTRATGQYSHAEGSGSIASGKYAHSEGWLTTASNIATHAEGYQTYAFGQYSHAEGYLAAALGQGSHAEGWATQVGSVASYAHAEGGYTLAAAYGSHAEGYFTTSSANYSHSEGSLTVALGFASHAEGRTTTTSADASYAHAEGISTIASGGSSHAEGTGTTSVGAYSHAEGQQTVTYGVASHAEGRLTNAIGDYSHAAGLSTEASGTHSYAGGWGTITSGSYQHVVGKYNQRGNNFSLFIIGDGTGTTNASRSDIVRVNPGLAAGTGRLEVTGTIVATQGISGSLTNLTNGSSYLVQGLDILVVTGSTGQVTISAARSIPTITTGTAAPTGGSNGDIYLQFT